MMIYIDKVEDQKDIIKSCDELLEHIKSFELKYKIEKQEFNNTIDHIKILVSDLEGLRWLVENGLCQIKTHFQ